MEFYKWFWTRPDRQYNYEPKSITGSPERWEKFPLDKSLLVSTYGRVKKNGKLLKQADSHGYKVAAGRGVHRLVAITFLPNPDNLPVVNHIDGNRSNNNIDNLEWVSQQDNTKHACYVLNNSMVKHRVERVEDGYIFKSAGEAAKVMDCNRATISHACNSGTMAQGFHWRYIKK